MTKTALIASLAEELGVSKKLAAELVNAFIDTVMNGVKKEGEVRIQGFGTFKASKRKAREGVNPQNPSQKIKIYSIIANLNIPFYTCKYKFLFLKNPE